MGVRRGWGGLAGGDALRVVLGATVALALVTGCSSDADSDAGGTGVAAPSTATSDPSVVSTPDDGPSLGSICELISTEEVDAITGLTLELRQETMAAGAPYDRCAWEFVAGNTVGASIVARSLVNEGVASPDEWWSRNLGLLEDAVLALRPLPAFGDDAYLATDERTVDVLWFPDPATYVEARVDAAGWGSAPRPSTAELEAMVLELSELFAERLEPHLPLPEPQAGGS